MQMPLCTHVTVGHDQTMCTISRLHWIPKTNTNTKPTPNLKPKSDATPSTNPKNNIACSTGKVNGLMCPAHFDTSGSYRQT